MVLWETTFGLFIARQEKGLPRKSQKHSLKNMNNDCLFFLSIYKLISEWTKEYYWNHKYLKADLDFKTCHSSFFEKAQKKNTNKNKQNQRIVDAVVGQGNLVQ